MRSTFVTKVDQPLVQLKAVREVDRVLVQLIAVPILDWYGSTSGTRYTSILASLRMRSGGKMHW